MSETDQGFLAALEEGKKGAAEGGVPIGACLVSKDGKILGQGHNMRVQNGSAILHVSTRKTPNAYQNPQNPLHRPTHPPV
jgi:cytosine/creatinine deaminase